MFGIHHTDDRCPDEVPEWGEKWDKIGAAHARARRRVAAKTEVKAWTEGTLRVDRPLVQGA